MAGFPVSPVKTWIPGEVLTASDLNAEFQNGYDNNTPESIDDYSANDAEMQSTTDPYPGAAISKPTDLAGEIARQRYQFNQILGKINFGHNPASNHWYEDPVFNPVLTITTATTTYAVLATDQILLCDASGGAFTATLPAASGVTGKRLIIVKTDSSTNPVTIDGNGAETIGGAANKILRIQYEYLVLVCDGTKWFIDSERKTPSPVGKWKNLHAKSSATSNQQIDIECDAAVLEAVAGGHFLLHTGIDVTIDLSTSGANGLDTGSLAANTAYHLYLISNGSTLAGIASTSSGLSGVTMPSGYTWGLLVSWCVTDETADPFNVEEFEQYDRKWSWKDAQKVVNNGGSTTTAAINLSYAGLSTYNVVPGLGIVTGIRGKVLSNTGALTWFAKSITFPNTLAVDNTDALSQVYLAAANASAEWSLNALVEDHAMYHQCSANTVDVWVTGFELRI